MRFFYGKSGIVAAMLLSVPAVQAQKVYEWKEATSGGYTYKYVTNDPMKARFYTLKNGLKVILSQNTKEPRIAVNIPVRTGSNNDPADHTGLAHYLEHLLFKGTDKFGSLDWNKEQTYLDQITQLYDQYNKIPTTDSVARKAQYHAIDSISGVASHYAIANEYDKLMASLGSQGTNAHTSVEETVYEEDVPSNALDKLLLVQGERFRNPQFRLFHTELEAVYEEKNRGLDNDNSKMWEAMNAAVFPTSNYGQQTTIGTIEHLKNPSLIAIRNYYNKYYVANNMAIVMAGDFDPDEVVKKVDAYFSYMKPGDPSDYISPAEKPIAGPVIKEVYGPDAESVRIAFRLGKSGTHEAVLAELLGEILNNGKAGLIDLNLNKTQKILGGNAGVYQMKDYGEFILSARPRQGQNLEEVKTLLLDQLNLLRQGKFDSSLIKATVANYKLSELKGLESNGARVQAMMKAFINNRGDNWLFDVAETDQMAKVTQKELVQFANTVFTDNNYVVVYKRKGEDKNIVKVEKPAISPVETNAGHVSDFVKSVTETPLPAIKPVWVDYKKDLQKGKLGKAAELYVPNKENSLFNLYYYFDLGSYNNKLLPVALTYLQYLGTNKYSSEDISKKFYALAANFSANAGTENTTLAVSGLDENFTSAVSLFEELLRNSKADTAALTGLKNRLMKSRADAKLNKRAIASALNSYALYGAKNPSNYTLSDEEIKNLKAEDLIAIIHTLPSYAHKVLYYGPKTLPLLNSALAKVHPLPVTWKAAPAAVKFDRQSQTENQVLFNNYDMVQSEIYWVRKLDNFDTTKIPLVNIFNEYFGGNMGSVVFQTIRESKALAYSTYAFVTTPSKKEDPFGFIGYVGSQADKHTEAIAAMNELIGKVPASQQNFDNGIIGLKKNIETERIRNENIIFSYLALQKQGISSDIRKYTYQQYNKYKLADVVQYHDQELATKPYTYTIMASDKKIAPETLSKYGKVKVVTLEELFGY